MTDMLLLALDPGTRHTGYTILDGAYALQDCGTWRPESRLRGMSRDLWLKGRLLALIAQWQPSHIIFEDFVWQEDKGKDHKFVQGRADMERLIGGIQMLALLPPQPKVSAALPQVWGREFCGYTHHTKHDIAVVVNHRLGTSFRGDQDDNHAADCAALACWHLDHLHYQARLDAAERLAHQRRRRR